MNLNITEKYNSKHPECPEDYILYCNSHIDNVAEYENNFPGLYVGQIAYNIFGNPVQNSVPIFIPSKYNRTDLAVCNGNPGFYGLRLKKEYNA